jgi:hypothetical protein
VYVIVTKDCRDYTKTAISFAGGTGGSPILRESAVVASLISSVTGKPLCNASHSKGMPVNCQRRKMATTGVTALEPLVQKPKAGALLGW